MSNITSTQDANTEFAGGKKLVVVTAPATDAAGDIICFTATSHGITAIDAIVGCNITAGVDDLFNTVSVSYSRLEVTVKYWANGFAATDLTGATISLAVLGTI